MSEQNDDKADMGVAPADEGYVMDGKDRGFTGHIPHPDQPVFPAPIGMSREELEEQGIASRYAGLPEDGSSVGTSLDGEGGATPSDPATAEGQGTDPNAEGTNDSGAASQ